MLKANSFFLSLAASFAALLCLPSCVTTDLSLASDFVPTNRNIPIKIAEFDINLGQRYPDSLQTLLSGRAIVGSINTEEFGVLNIGAAMAVAPKYDSIRWGGSPKFKMMRLAIPVTSCFCRDDRLYSIPQNIYFHKMLKPIDSTTVYAHSFTRDDYEKKQCTISSAIYTADDSLCVMFTEEFAKPLFDLDSTVMDSTELFLEKFYGVYMETEDALLNGGRLNTFDMSNAVMTFTFSSINYEGIRRDTTVYFSIGEYASVMKIEQDKKISECDSTDQTAIYDGMLGIKPVIDARKLKANIEELAKKEGLSAKAIMISKAQFNFPFEYPGSNDGFTNWPGNMFLFQRFRDSTGFVYYSPISEIYSTNYDTGSANRSKMSYRPDAALYIQTLLNTPLEEIDDSYDLWVMPTVSMSTSSSSSSTMDYYSYYYYYYYGYDPYSSSSSETYYYVDNLNYLTCKLYGSKAPVHPTLRITYTLLR